MRDPLLGHGGAPVLVVGSDNADGTHDLLLVLLFVICIVGGSHREDLRPGRRTIRKMREQERPINTCEDVHEYTVRDIESGAQLRVGAVERRPIVELNRGATQ